MPNSKFKLHRTRKFCRTYELQYTHFFSGQTVSATLRDIARCIKSQTRLFRYLPSKIFDLLQGVPYKTEN